MNRTRHWWLCVGLAVAVAGCGKNSPHKQPASASALGPHQARISPSTLFNEHTRLLEPHLGLTANGAVQIEYAGPEKWIAHGYEVWRNGEIVQPITWSEGDEPVPFSGKLTVSLEDVSEYTDEPKIKLIYALVTETANDRSRVSCSTSFPKHEQTARGASPKQLSEPLLISAGDWVAVWGYMVGKGSETMSGDESICEMAKRVEWALVMKVRVGKAKKAP